MNITLHPGKLKKSDLKLLLNETNKLTLDKKCHAAIKKSAEVISNVVARGKTTYGVTTGFGALANTTISKHELTELQKNLVLSHACGCGEFLDDKIVRLILILKINCLARGYSGVKLTTIDALIKLLNANIYPCIPSQGSVGASGDLAPLAHLSCILLGVGHARYRGKIITAKKALQLVHLKPLQLAPKEGLALLNGTQVSTSIALIALFAAEDLLMHALIAGAMSTDAARASYQPFDARIQKVRGHLGQIQVASKLRALLKDSQINASRRDRFKVQDPYSLRCQPQVMGACSDLLNIHSKTLLIEANAVSDNPLIFNNSILTGGNFHAENVAFAADGIALAIAEIGALSERRIALLVDPHFSGLPAFLVKNSGLHSGFMLAQVTAASLASENKSLAHPASVDSIPTSANQEDHVSMATFAARRLFSMIENTNTIVGIELLAAAQGIDLLKPLKTSPSLQKAHKLIRESIAFYAKDRYFAKDIAAIKSLMKSCALL